MGGAIPLFQQIIALIGFLFLVFAAAGIGGIAASDAGDFYDRLVRPGWAPPAWVFAPVWSLLYLFMGVAAWLVWRVRGFRGVKVALVLFLFQLAANSLWTWLFFGWRKGALASAEILILWALILATVVAFWRVTALSGMIMLPYLAWVTFACALTLKLCQLNPSLLG